MYTLYITNYMMIEGITIVVETVVELVTNTTGRHLRMETNQVINIPCQYQM